MASPKVVLWRPMYNPVGHALLADAGARVVIVDSPDAQKVMAELPDADALWVRTPERVTGDMLEAGKALTVVSTSGFGTDNIDLEAATRLGILVVNHQGFGRTPVAEHVLALLLASLKQLTWGDRAVRDGSAWTERSGMAIHELEGRTVGLIGLGYIGSEIARKLKLAFNCRVLAYDPYVNPRVPLLAGVEMVAELKAMLGRCQVLCLCAELTPETRGMVGAEALRALPKDAVVVNAARGQMLDLEALLAALDDGHLLAAGLDVTYPEPLPAGHPLLRHPRVTLTPHTAGVTVEATARLAQSACDQILAGLRGEVPRYPINPAAWEGPASRRRVKV